MHPDSVRGTIKAFLCEQAPHFGRDVLELGSLLPGPHATWANNRDLAPRANWVGMDMQPGPGVDVVGNAEAPGYWEEFDTVLCSEVLEHVQDPLAVFRGARMALRRGGRFVVTTLTTFPIHNYPADYWRFTPQGLELLFRAAGFQQWTVREGGAPRQLMLTNTGAEPARPFNVYLHVFGTGVK